MKLRLKGNSIRLRLTRSEVERLAAGEAVAESVNFGRDRAAFTYSIEVSGVSAIAAEYLNDTMRVLLPEPVARQWTDSEEVGIEAAQGNLTILIEKDFLCMKPRAGEDESDMFPNPSVAAGAPATRK